ncbi:MAG: CDP-alcohol phosphatidyltransferase family protein [Thermoanaerobaculia bacterium]
MHVWRARLHRWFAPLAARCPLSPNAITLIALGLNATAAFLLYRGEWIAAIVLVIVGGLADAFDGIVARVQEKSSKYGDFLDHFADRISDTLIVSGWLIGNGVRVEILIGAVICVTLNGYIGTQIEATWHERNYDSVGRGEFVLALIVFPLVSHILGLTGTAALRFAGFTVAEWMALLLIVFALIGIVQRLALARRLEKQA